MDLQDWATYDTTMGDPAKAKENLGFRATVDLAKGLQILFEEFKK